MPKKVIILYDGWHYRVPGTGHGIGSKDAPFYTENEDDARNTAAARFGKDTVIEVRRGGGENHET